MKKSGNILIVDDNRGVLTALQLLLKPYFDKITTLSSPVTLPGTLREDTWKVVLLDMNFTSGINTGNEGLYWLHEIKKQYPSLPVVLFTAYADIDLAVRGIKEGATDFVVKPWDNGKLVETLLNAAQDTPTSGKKKATAATAVSSMYWGESSAMQQLRMLVEKVAVTDANILITGENGTGKELLARAIHRLSRRRERPFVAVNLGGLARSLFESEMFGYARGAFTGADSDRAGRFETADSGTIFLDEIGDLDASCQVKMLRVLQEHTFERLGESHPRRVDIRVVCATNVDLPAAVASGAFREDLYYRINLITLHMPALRERREDIPLLVRHFAGDDVTVTPEAMRMLEEQPYPGNIRELQNLVKRLVIMTETGRITPEDVRKALAHSSTSAIAARPASEPVAETALTLEEMERKAISDAIARCGGNLSQVASALGITRQSLYRRMEKFGLQP